MSHLNSVRVPAAIIFTALLIIILVSSSHTTYKLAPADGVDAQAFCAAPAAGVRGTGPRHACPWPRRARHHWADFSADPWTDWANAAPDHAAPRGKISTED